MTAVAEAIEMKNKGNAAIAHKDWRGAVVFYDKAIELDPTQAVFYSNRAQSHIKLESFGFAISDATKAIELDPNYVKAYYRRAISYLAITKHKDALKDFKAVCRKAPNDKDAKLKMQECEKMVKRIDFLKAIEMGDPPSAAEGLDLNAMVVEEGYDGIRLEEEITAEFVEDMIQRFKDGKKIHRKYVYQIVLKGKEIFSKEPTMPEVTIGEGKKITVCGDTHGMCRVRAGVVL
jgi:serine/threonine-protein phosphatase 5